MNDSTPCELASRQIVRAQGHLIRHHFLLQSRFLAPVCTKRMLRSFCASSHWASGGFKGKVQIYERRCHGEGPAPTLTWLSTAFLLFGSLMTDSCSSAIFFIFPSMSMLCSSERV